MPPKIPKIFGTNSENQIRFRIYPHTTAIYEVGQR